jgi:hypothetical protein
MAKPAHIAAHELDDDEPIFTTPNQQRIIRAGECARAEQQRLEQLLGLQDGRPPDRKRDPGGISIKRRHGRPHLSPLRVRTPLISQIFLVPFGLRNRVLLAGLLSLTVLRTSSFPRLRG